MLCNASELRRLHARIHETFALRDRSKADLDNWKSAAKAFRAKYTNLAFPYSEAETIDGLASGEPAIVEAVLCFLECRPYFFRSGYMWSRLLRKTRSATLSNKQAARLTAVLERRELWRTISRAHKK